MIIKKILVSYFFYPTSRFHNIYIMKPTCNLLGWEAFFGFFAQFNWGIFPDLFPSSEGNSGGPEEGRLHLVLPFYSYNTSAVIYPTGEFYQFIYCVNYSVTLFTPLIFCCVNYPVTVFIVPVVTSLLLHFCYIYGT